MLVPYDLKAIGLPGLIIHSGFIYRRINIDAPRSGVRVPASANLTASSPPLISGEHQYSVPASRIPHSATRPLFSAT